jgi:hypothetical protein
MSCAREHTASWRRKGDAQIQADNKGYPSPGPPVPICTLPERCEARRESSPTRSCASPTARLPALPTRRRFTRLTYRSIVPSAPIRRAAVRPERRSFAADGRVGGSIRSGCCGSSRVSRAQCSWLPLNCRIRRLSLQSGDDDPGRERRAPFAIHSRCVAKVCQTHLYDLAADAASYDDSILLRDGAVHHSNGSAH